MSSFSRSGPISRVIRFLAQNLGPAALFLCAIAAFALSLGATAVRAADLPAPKGEVLLTVSGLIANHNSDAGLQLDMEQLQALPQATFTTTTQWTQGARTFTGVLLKDLLAAAGATGGTLTLTAANDYAITMPAADAGDDAPLLAILMDGKPMSLREKGPVWMVYPYDADDRFRTEETFSRSIWQLTDISLSD